METLAGVLLLVLTAAFLSALIQGRGRQWLRAKFLGKAT